MSYGTIFCKLFLYCAKKSDEVAATASKEIEKRESSIIIYQFQRECARSEQQTEI